MSTFPQLKTGAVMQYPASVIHQYGTDVVVFLDGTEQRNRKLPGLSKRWLIDLSLLDDTEVRVLEEFFIAQSGSYGSFSFSDPWSGTTYADCHFAEDALVINFDSPDRAKLRLTVMENRQ